MQVFINYCDGGSYAGSVVDPVSVNGNNIYFRGRCEWHEYRCHSNCNASALPPPPLSSCETINFSTTIIITPPPPAITITSIVFTCHRASPPDPGADILDAIYDNLLGITSSSFGMNTAQNVVVKGCSAGGCADRLLTCQPLAQPDATLRVSPQHISSCGRQGLVCCVHLNPIRVSRRSFLLLPFCRRPGCVPAHRLCGRPHQRRQCSHAGKCRSDVHRYRCWRSGYVITCLSLATCRSRPLLPRCTLVHAMLATPLFVSNHPPPEPP